jgi:hypothetical protein
MASLEDLMDKGVVLPSIIEVSFSLKTEAKITLKDFYRQP